MKINLENTYEILLSTWEVEKKKLWEFLWEDKTIFYFYPKDNTPWCIIENKDFSCLKEKFEELWYKLIWFSKDSIESHKRFVEKQELNIDLISDPEVILYKELWAYWEKNNYWKIIMWVIRSTFIVDKSWEVLAEYKNIRAKWHAQRVLDEVSK